MLTVAGRPILERIILLLAGQGIKRVYLAVHYLASVIEQHFGDGSKLGVDLRYLREEKPLGTGGALSLLPEVPTAPLVVMNGGALEGYREYIGQVRTTCVPTMVEGGHARNALPQKVTANVNCRIFPGVPAEDVRRTLEQVIDNPAMTVTRSTWGCVWGWTS